MPGGGSEAVILPALMGGSEAVAAAGIPAFMGAALDSAAIGGLGSMLFGGDPLKGALLGGLTGGVGKAVFPQGLGELFGGGMNAPEALANEAISPALAGADATLANPVANAASSGIGSKLAGFLPYAGLAGGAMLLDKAGAPKQVGPEMRKEPTSGPVAALDRTQQTVDPASYMTAGGNRNFYQPYRMQPQYLARGGKVQHFDDGGSASTGHSTMPVGLGMVRGRGNGMDDKIPAMLSDGEFVVSAPVVSALGNGSNDAGARKLDKLQKKVIHKHYKGSPKKSVGLGAMH